MTPNFLQLEKNDKTSPNSKVCKRDHTGDFQGDICRGRLKELGKFRHVMTAGDSRLTAPKRRK